MAAVIAFVDKFAGMEEEKTPHFRILLLNDQVDPIERVAPKACVFRLRDGNRRA